MNGKDLERFAKKIVFMRMKDGFIQYVYIEKVESDSVTCVSARDKVSIFPPDEVLSIRELDQKERMKFMSMRQGGGF